MLLRVIGGFALLALLASIAVSLQRSDFLRSWLGSTPDTAKPIVFDNGSVRDLPANRASEPVTLAALAPPGALRKCVRGDRVMYSNLTCPAGFSERTVASNNLTVLPAAPAAKAERAEDGAKPGGRQAVLQEALDLKRDDKLRQRMIDRAVAAEAK